MTPHYAGPWTYTMRLTTILTLNDRRHWAVLAPIKKRIRVLSHAHASNARIPRQDFIIVGTLFHPPTLRYRDADNAMATVKPIIDGIRDAGVVADDDAAHVTFVAPLFGKPTGYPWWSVEVTISTSELIEQEPRAPRSANGHAQCGTTAGYSQHRREKTLPCVDCRAAESHRKATSRKATRP